MFLLIAWAAVASAAILIAGGFMARFSSGLMIPYSVLSAFGIAGLLERRHTWNRFAFVTAIVVMLSTALTSLCSYVSILIQPVPTIDIEVAEAAAKIREISGTTIPTVLTDCDTAVFLPSIAGLRVFAGHWSLTPAFQAKCDLLSLSGFSATRDSVMFDPAKLDALLRAVHPGYILIRSASPAETWLQSTGRASVISAGSRWSTLSTRLSSLQQTERGN